MMRPKFTEVAAILLSSYQKANIGVRKFNQHVSNDFLATQNLYVNLLDINCLK